MNGHPLGTITNISELLSRILRLHAYSTEGFFLPMMLSIFDMIIHSFDPDRPDSSNVEDFSDSEPKSAHPEDFVDVERLSARLRLDALPDETLMIVFSSSDLRFVEALETAVLLRRVVQAQRSLIELELNQVNQLLPFALLLDQSHVLFIDRQDAIF